MESIVCQNSGAYETDVIFYYLGYNVQNQLAKQLGCELDNEEGFVRVNESQQTTVRNVYAVGDVDTDRHYIVLLQPVVQLLQYRFMNSFKRCNQEYKRESLELAVLFV